MAFIPSVDDSDWWIAVGAGSAGKADLTKPAGAGEENQRSRSGLPQARNNPDQDPTVLVLDDADGDDGDVVFSASI